MFTIIIYLGVLLTNRTRKFNERTCVAVLLDACAAKVKGTQGQGRQVTFTQGRNIGHGVTGQRLQKVECLAEITHRFHLKGKMKIQNVLRIQEMQPHKKVY